MTYMNWHKLNGKYKNKKTDRDSAVIIQHKNGLSKDQSANIISTSDLLVGSIYQKYLNVRMIHVHV